MTSSIQYDKITISTPSSSAHVEERDEERIPKPVSTGVENGQNSFQIWSTAAGYGELCVWF